MTNEELLSKLNEILVRVIEISDKVTKLSE